MQNAHDDPNMHMHNVHKAAFALYRPELHQKLPLDSQTAVRKYRMEHPQTQYQEGVRERQIRMMSHDQQFRHAGKGAHQRTGKGRSYGGNGGIVSYLGTGDGSRTVKNKNNSLVHGAGFQNAGMHQTSTQRVRNSQNAVATMHNHSTSVPSSGQQTGFTHHMNIDMNMQDPHSTFPLIMNENRNQ